MAQQLVDDNGVTIFIDDNGAILFFDDLGNWLGNLPMIGRRKYVVFNT